MSGGLDEYLPGEVAHSAFTTAMVFVVMQFVAFTVYFNKTYVGSLDKAMAVPTAHTAYKFNSGSASQQDIEDMMDMCNLPRTDIHVDRMNLVNATAKYIEERVPRTDVATSPDYVGAALFVFCPLVFAAVYYLRRSDSAQAMFNGALICSIFTIGEIVGWLVVNVPVVQRAMNRSLRKGLKTTLENNESMCQMLGPQMLATPRSGTDADAYQKARMHDGTNMAARRRLWVPAVAIVFGCLGSAAMILAAGRAKMTYKDCGREVLATTFLVGIAQWYFIQYTMGYKFYGSEEEGMASVTTAAVCRAVGGPGLPPLLTMPPSLVAAAKAPDTEIKGSTILRIIFGTYAIGFALLTLRVGTWTSTMRNVAVAVSGWLTEAYFYQFVVAETTFVTWPQIEGTLVDVGHTACKQSTPTALLLPSTDDEPYDPGPYPKRPPSQQQQQTSDDAVALLTADTPARLY